MDESMEAPEVIPCKVNIYGVSALSTKEIIGFIKTKMVNCGEIKIEWIDDDNCNAVFLSDEEAAAFISAGENFEGGIDEERSMIVPREEEGEEPQNLIIRRARDVDVKNQTRSWKESKYYKKKLEEKGINPNTLRPVSRVILKPRDGVVLKPKSKVSLIPRKLVNEAKSAIYGEDAFSKKRERIHKRNEQIMVVVDEEEIIKRQDRAKRFR